MIQRRFAGLPLVASRFRTPGRFFGPGFGFTLLVAIVAGEVSAAVKPVVASQEATEVEGLVFVGVAEARTNRPRSMDAAKSRARLDAIRRMLESRLEPEPRWEALSSNVRAAIDALVVGYLQSRIDLDSMATFETVIDDRTVTVHLRVPAETMEPYRLTLDRVVDLGWERSRSGTPVSFLERATILEAMRAEDARRAALIESMSPHDGAIAASRTGSWGPVDGPWSAEDSTSEIGPFTLWSLPLRRLVAEGRALPARPAIDDGRGPLPWDAGEERRPPVDELIVLALRSWNAPALLRTLEERLRLEGWPNTAQLFETQAESPRFDGAALSRVDRSEPRRRAIESVFGSTRLLRQYLSEGRATVGGPAPSGPEFSSAEEAFNIGTPEALQKVVGILAHAAGTRWLSADEWNLLAAAMFALEEPALSRSFAATAFHLQPEHVYAGINLLRADRALGLREEATQLIGRVETQAALNDWGRQRLAEIRVWLEEPRPTPSDKNDGATPASGASGPSEDTAEEVPGT